MNTTEATTTATPSTTSNTTKSPSSLAAQAIGFRFTLQAQDGQARAGEFVTPHGVIHTPMFMPVGTNSTVKTLTWDQVEGTQAEIVLANAYHMYLRPGHQLVAKAGGLHQWSNWQKPILTDSGGFQVFSLAKLRKLTEAGVQFRSPVDGSKHFIGPEESMAIQNALGADIIMAFDECPPYPVTLAEAKKSLDLTHRWLARCVQAHARKHDQALFPIVQGSVYKQLREEAAAHVAQYDAVGYAIGGVSVGEPRPLIHAITRFTAPLLPKHKPRYLMGVGTVPDLLQGIHSGVDLFDCVLPSRNARHGTFLTAEGNKNIKKADYTEDFTPLEEGCDCYTCQNHTKAYVRHLFRQDEATAKTLLTIHNIRALIRLTQQCREAILEGRFEAFFTEQCERWA
ncbi:MAG: tRNA guanosine(34) transglycosylase Tgt, partial [Vampirovibrionales bacterium]